MAPEIQDLLARNLQHLRNAKSTRSGELRSIAAFAEGAISALEEVRAITTAEGRVWRDRIYEVLTESSPVPHRRRRAAPIKPPSGIVRRVIAGPLEPESFFDGWVRVVAVELHEQFVRVHWTVSPLPSHESVLGDDLPQLDRDTTGLPEPDRQHQRDTARLMRLHGMLRLSLSDDLGTAYRFKRGHQNGSFELNEQSGQADFYPPIPDGASVLQVGIARARIIVPVALA